MLSIEFVIGFTVGIIAWLIIGFIVAVLDAAFGECKFTGAFGHISAFETSMTVILWFIPVLVYLFLFIFTKLPKLVTSCVERLAQKIKGK